jgi:gluconolactonase
MKSISTIFVFALFLIFVQNCGQKTEIPLTNEITILEDASFEVIDDEFYKYIAKETKVEILANGHEWTEGPVWVESEKMLLYSDIPNNAIYSWKEGESAKLYLENAGGSTTSNEGSNGLYVKDGKLILCQHGARQIAYMDTEINNPSNDFISIVDSYENNKLNSPNDLTFSTVGNLYFTDPPYGLDKGDEDPMKELSHNGVYCLTTDNNLLLLSTEFTRPNGISLSADEKQLIVANSDRNAAYWYRFTINSDNTLSNKTLIFDATEYVNDQNPGLPDGLKVHSSGALFATGPGGLYIFSPEYALLGIVRTTRATANIAFDTNEQNVYLTADDLVLRIQINL